MELFISVFSIFIFLFFSSLVRAGEINGTAESLYIYLKSLMHDHTGYTSLIEKITQNTDEKVFNIRHETMIGEETRWEIKTLPGFLFSAIKFSSDEFYSIAVNWSGSPKYKYYGFSLYNEIPRSKDQIKPWVISVTDSAMGCKATRLSLVFAKALKKRIEASKGVVLYDRNGHCEWLNEQDE